MAFRVIVFAALVLCVAAHYTLTRTDEELFEKFLNQQKKVYSSPEERAHRFSVFKENMKIIREHNSKRGITYTMGLGPWTDLTNAEYRRMLTFRPSPMPRTRADASSFNPETLPDDVDWRDHNAVTEVKDQGQCGSCWSFSAVGTIEGAHAIKTNKLVELSEQNIIDCTWQAPYNNTGCDGGDMRPAIQYVIDNKGIDTEDSYQYDDGNGGDREDCVFRRINVGATVSAMVDIIQGNETDLAVQTLLGPISIAIDASQDSFQNYESGIYYESACENDMNSLDHGVTIVGYSGFGDGAYWIVKNSWSSSWGNDGYIWMAKDDENQCGVATYATRAVA